MEVSVREKNQNRGRAGQRRGGLGAVLNRLVPPRKWQPREDLREGKRRNGSSRGRGNSQYKGPEVGECLAREGSDQETGEAGGARGVADATEEVRNSTCRAQGTSGSLSVKAVVQI